jgi:FlaA1/EpsC-like NDP-sugar epimerase
VQRYLLPAFLFILDTLILCVSAWLSMIVRFPEQTAQYAFYTPAFTRNLPVMLCCYLLCYVLFHLHQRIWQYAGAREMVQIVAANVGGFLLFGVYAWSVHLNLPRSVYYLAMGFATIFTLLSRLALHYIYYRINQEERSGKGIPVLIVGAGDAGHLILLDIQQRDKRKVVGLIDDDPAKKGRIMNGVRILGDRAEIPQAVAKYGVKEIIIAIPSLPAEDLQKLAELCSACKVAVSVIPSFFSSLEDPKIRVQDLRPLSIEDLLDRDPIHLDIDKIGGYLKGKTVLVTGAGGSIGSEICRQVLKLYPKKLLLLGRGENSIYEIHQELKDEYPPDVLQPLIINVACRESLERVFEVFHPQVVFHAAAHKHVPLMEHQPREAIYNNVGGSLNLAELAGEYRVERFVLISTDKAVNPTSVMGATKRVTEMIMQALNKKFPDTIYVAVRFGNVLGSRGSVVPLFKKQIAAGGPVTVTDAGMQRYFMTIPEASQLVLEAAALGKGGEVFVLDMGKPVKILDLAKNMIRLSGLQPDQDIKIRFTGLRPGEKLFEELLTAEEGTVATQNKKIYQAIIKDQDPEILRPKLHELLRCMDSERCIKLLQDLIPTYKPNHF